MTIEAVEPTEITVGDLQEYAKHIDTYSMGHQQSWLRTNQTWEEKVAYHKTALRSRGGARAHEDLSPHGQAAEWYWDVIHSGPSRNAAHVARQIARLCGDDSKVTTTWRSLVAAVGERDAIGRTNAPVESGVEVLVRHGWLTREVNGKGCAASTTFYLMPGELPDGGTD